MRPLTRLIAALLLLALPQGCGNRNVAPFQVATNVWPGYEPLYLARQLGLLDPNRIRLLEVPNSTDGMRALKSGLIPAAALTLDEVLTLQQDGVDLRIVLVMAISKGADVLMGRPGLASLQDLKGRRIGVENSAVGAYLLNRTLDHAGLRPQDVVPVPIAVHAHEKAFRSGSIDALVTFDPVRSRLLKDGAVLLFDSSRIPNEIFDVLVVRTEALRSQPRIAETLRTAWFSALDQYARDPRDSARRMAPRERLEPEAFMAVLAGLEFPDRSTEAGLRNGGLLVPARRLADLMLEKRLLVRPVDPANLLAAP